MKAGKPRWTSAKKRAAKLARSQPKRKSRKRRDWRPDPKLRPRILRDLEALAAETSYSVPIPETIGLTTAAAWLASCLRDPVCSSKFDTQLQRKAESLRMPR